MSVTFGSLFAGIGGFDLGFERAGMVCKWQVEINEFSLKVLSRHWPRVNKYGDIKKLTGRELGHVRVICGGFPCQPVSYAGNRLAQDDERWLWPEFFRIVCGIRPEFVVVENVPGLLSAGIDEVLGDLASGGYDAEWQSLSAQSFGAPHIRERVYLVAYPNGKRWTFFEKPNRKSDERQKTIGGYAKAKRCEDRQLFDLAPRHCIAPVWIPQPGVKRVLDGIPAELDELRCTSLGNAVMPDIAEWIGKRIMELAP